MRIVAGRLRGRTLVTPDSGAIRPTADRSREALFNMLAHRFAGRLEGARVIDLFAGTGALGCEALSRGASFCLFVEEAALARGLIRSNVERLGLEGCTKIFRRDATRLGRVGTLEPFDLLLADPPYARGLGERALQAAREGGWLKRNALCVVEERAGVDFDAGADFVLREQRSYGQSVIRVLELA